MSVERMLCEAAESKVQQKRIESELDEAILRELMLDCLTLDGRTE